MFVRRRSFELSLNGEIERQQIFDEIFVQPASGDAGVAIGACYLATAEQRSNLQPKKQHNFYLGSGFSKDQITDLLEEMELDYEIPKNIFKSTAEYLEQGKIVGWFQGRAEFGPRALGNRSILTRPYPASMKDYLNSRVKFRESFRPFAPAVLYERASDYFEIQQESPHMLIATQATSLARKKIPATVHVDNSCRVQTVRKENNPRFYNLLCSFQELTDCPVLLNTSFVNAVSKLKRFKLVLIVSSTPSARLTTSVITSVLKLSPLVLKRSVNIVFKNSLIANASIKNSFVKS